MRDTLIWFLVNFAIFVPLAFLIPARPEQPKFHFGTLIDCFYFFCTPALYQSIFRILLLFFGSLGLFHYFRSHLCLNHLPLVVQVIIILLLTDFLQYWVHRIFHHPRLWKFHAVHHSAIHVDWLTSVRFHPLNFIVYSTLINVFVVSLGFSYQAFIILIPFNALFSALVHANLNWTYGPFKYVLASPVFHRWHHTYPHEGGNKNFAPNFPFFDLLFGTFYMPQDKKPELFGTKHGPADDDLVNQLVYPFISRVNPAAGLDGQKNAALGN